MRDRLVIYAVLFGAYIGISLPLPLMGPLIMSAESPFTLATQNKFMALSFVLAAFPLGNLLGAPFIGFISDKIGRKKVLTAGLLGGAFFYIISGIAISFGTIFLLVVSRFLSGICEGTAAIAQSHLADGADPASKPKLFGVMVAVISVGYVAGPLVGGLCINSDIISFASYSLPFYVVAIFLSATLVMVHLCFVSNVPHRESHSLLEGIKILFCHTIFMRLIMLALLLAIGRSLYIDFLASFLNLRFGLNGASTTWLWVLLAAVWALSALLTDVLKNIVSYKMKMISACALASCTVFPLAFSQSLLGFTIVSSLMVVGLALTATLNTVFVSDEAPKAHLGLAMGFLSSTYLLGEVIACLFGGGLLHINDAMPFIVSGFLLTLVTILFFLLFYRTRTTRLVRGI